MWEEQMLRQWTILMKNDKKLDIVPASHVTAMILCNKSQQSQLTYFKIDTGPHYMSLY